MAMARPPWTLLLLGDMIRWVAVILLFEEWQLGINASGLRSRCRLPAISAKPCLSHYYKHPSHIKSHGLIVLLLRPGTNNRATASKGRRESGFSHECPLYTRHQENHNLPQPHSTYHRAQYYQYYLATAMSTITPINAHLLFRKDITRNSSRKQDGR